MNINRTCCNALIGTEQEQINQLYEFVKALAGKYFEGFEIMGTYSPTVNYNKKYMLVSFEGSTYIKTVDGDSVNFSPALNPDKWALFSSGTPADLSDLEKVIEGSETVVVDVNETGTALEIHADYENIVKPLERALKKPISNPTETVLAGVDAQGEQVLLPVSGVGGGAKWYRHKIDLIADFSAVAYSNSIGFTISLISTYSKPVTSASEMLYRLGTNNVVIMNDFTTLLGPFLVLYQDVLSHPFIYIAGNPAKYNNPFAFVSDTVTEIQ